MELLTIKQTAEVLKVSTTTVRDMVRDGELPHLRVRRQIRFVRDELEAWVRSKVRGGDGGKVPELSGAAKAASPN